MAARKAIKATEAKPAMKGNESFFTAKPGNKDYSIDWIPFFH